MRYPAILCLLLGRAQVEAGRLRPRTERGEGGGRNRNRTKKPGSPPPAISRGAGISLGDYHGRGHKAPDPLATCSFLGLHVQTRTRLRWRQGAWAQRGLVPACLERRGGAPRCTGEPVRLYDPVLPGPVSALTSRNTWDKSRGLTRTQLLIGPTRTQRMRGAFLCSKCAGPYAQIPHATQDLAQVLAMQMVGLYRRLVRTSRKEIWPAPTAPLSRPSLVSYKQLCNIYHTASSCAPRPRRPVQPRFRGRLRRLRQRCGWLRLPGAPPPPPRQGGGGRGVGFCGGV
jgi:hypothetical protein